MKVFGIVGWKNSGKTGLVERLVTELCARGLQVSTLKHAHHAFDVDTPGRDSHRHRRAGASEVLVAGGQRWALMSELRGQPEPGLDMLIGKLAPVDVVLFEGWKGSPYPKIAVHRSLSGRDVYLDAQVCAVASDTALDIDIPVLDLNDTAAIANVIVSHPADAPFDQVIAVDWSARAAPSPAKPTKDSIFVADTKAVSYHRTRCAAIEHLSDTLENALARGQSTFLGFDFAFGYPTGFAQALTGTADPFAVWAWLAARIEDAPDNSNTRFEVAAQINRMFPGVGPFWGRPETLDLPDLPSKGSDRFGHGMPERRSIETCVSKAQPVWKLFTTGAVGSQSLLGIPRLVELRRRFPGQIRVWPFEDTQAPVTLVEIYPSLPGVPLGAGDILDAQQVDGVRRWVSAMTPDQMAKALQAPKVARQEGWIFGVGSQEESP